MKTKILWGMGILALVILVGAFIAQRNSPGRLDDFAKCLKTKGVTFYGAFWCPHCQNQKALFGRSEKYLPYVECSTPDGQKQLAICQKKKIESYPTWEFKGGKRKTGEVSLDSLAEESGCSLPK